MLPRFPLLVLMQLFVWSGDQTDRGADSLKKNNLKEKKKKKKSTFGSEICSVRLLYPLEW